MDVPDDLKYAKNDEWVKIEDNIAIIGISDFAQDQLSDIVYIEFSVSVGDSIKKGDIYGLVESVKASSDVYSPVGGKVLEINESLIDTPELVNSDPYINAWMIKLEISDPDEVSDLMDNKAYSQYIQERE